MNIAWMCTFNCNTRFNYTYPAHSKLFFCGFTAVDVVVVFSFVLTAFIFPSSESIKDFFGKRKRCDGQDNKADGEE